MKTHQKWDLSVLNSEGYKHLTLSSLRDFQKFKSYENIFKKNFYMEENH